MNRETEPRAAAIKQTKNVANHTNIDLSYEEQGFYKVGNKFIKTIFPR